MTWLTSSAQSVPAVQNVFLSNGVLGAIAFMALGFFVAALRYMVKLIEVERARADRAQADKDALAKDVMDRTLPVLTRSVEVLAEVADLLRGFERRDRR